MPKNKDIDFLLKSPEEVSIWKRGFAFLIDIIIIQFIVNITFSSYIKNNLGENKNFFELYNYINSNYELYSRFLLTLSIITSIMTLIYFALMEWKLNQSIGKMIFKIKVKSDNKKLKFKQVLLRNIPKALLFVNYVSWIFLLDIVYLSFKRIRFFDKLAQTNVVKIKN